MKHYALNICYNTFKFLSMSVEKFKQCTYRIALPKFWGSLPPSFEKDICEGSTGCVKMWMKIDFYTKL